MGALFRGVVMGLALLTIRNADTLPFWADFLLSIGAFVVIIVCAIDAHVNRKDRT